MEAKIEIKETERLNIENEYGWVAKFRNGYLCVGKGDVCFMFHSTGNVSRQVGSNDWKYAYEEGESKE